VIGVLAAIVYLISFWIIGSKFKVDDPLGACSVHGANGFWGLIALGIFADGSYGGVYGVITGHYGQLVSQAIGAVTAVAWAGILAFILFKLIGGKNSHSKMRVSDDVEKDGLDVHIHGTACYPEQ
jgi:Amt family ammonium transporter